jgi:drug/metabolite transporter (DMT)-like permease
VGRREIGGAAVVVAGLGLFAIFGAPSSGNDNAPNDQWAIALAVIGVVCGVLFTLGRKGVGPRKAALLGVVSGILFGTSACLVKPTIETLHDGVAEVLTHWEFYAMALTGIVAFVLQQASLSTGYLATSVSTVSVANPIVSVAIGVLLFDERLARPGWHIVVALGGLVLAMVGAIAISLARERRGGTEADTAAAAPAPAPA